MAHNENTPDQSSQRRDELLRRALATPPISNEDIIKRSKEGKRDGAAVNPGKPGDPAGPGRHWGTAKASGLED